MKFIPIKKIEKNNETIFTVSALSLEGQNGKQRKIPHPLGNDAISFKTLEEAKKAVELSGFMYILPDGSQALPAENFSLSEAYDKKIYDALMKQTKDLNPSIVAAAINALSEINHANCIDLFIDKIGEDNENVRNNSIDAILKHGISSLPMLFKAIESDNWVKKNSAIICLQKFCEVQDAPIDEIIEVLLKTLSDNNPIIKCSAIKGLGIAYKTYKSGQQ